MGVEIAAYQAPIFKAVLKREKIQEENLMTQVQSERVFHRANKTEWPQITHGEGVYLVDSEGRR